MNVPHDIVESAFGSECRNTWSRIMSLRLGGAVAEARDRAAEVRQGAMRVRQTMKGGMHIMGDVTSYVS